MVAGREGMCPCYNYYMHDIFFAILASDDILLTPLV